MTQDYEPIEITESTPEPKENGIYLLTITQCGERYSVPVWRDEIWRDIEGDHMWSELVDSIKNTGNPTIQSLAAHDAQIRAEALDFANAEQIDNGEKLLNESLSDVIKEYLLYGAHPLSTEDNSDDIWDDAELFKLKLTNGNVIDCSELASEALDGLKRYLSGQPILQSIPVKGGKQ